MNYWDFKLWDSSTANPIARQKKIRLVQIRTNSR